MMTYISYDLKFSLELKAFNPNIIFQSLVRQTDIKKEWHKTQKIHLWHLKAIKLIFQVTNPNEDKNRTYQVSFGLSPFGLYLLVVK